MIRFAAVGAGRMGRGIAIAFAYAGHRIALIDLRPRSAQAWARLEFEARGEIAQSLGALAQLGVLQPEQVERIASRVDCVNADAAPAALASAELIFEGVPETLDAKRDAFAKLSQWCDPAAILASTTSSMRVTQLASLPWSPSESTTSAATSCNGWHRSLLAVSRPPPRSLQE